jgi:uncharacterized protein (DUF1684 family)
MKYDDEIHEWRSKREKELKEGIKIGDMLWSPVPEEERGNLKLDYFPINSDYRFEASISKLENKITREYELVDGSASIPFLIVGYAEFKYENETIRLSVIFDKQLNSRYIAFRDSTSGKETYPNGRLLVVENFDEDSTVLDFNKAFNFACAYNETLSCPLTPPENWLSFAIEAGEKKYKIKSN